MNDSLTLDIQPEGIIINGTELKKPFSFTVLCEIFGKPTQNENPNVSDLTYSWDDIGVRAFVTPQSDIARRLDVYFSHRPNSKLALTTTFPGTVTIDGAPLTGAISSQPDDMGFIETSHGTIELSLLEDGSGSTPYAMLMIQGADPAPVASKEIVPLTPVKAANPIPFTDFNFKLAIIQELMFGEEPVLEPFTLSDFVARYSDRKINTATEGYEPIPEVVAFFEAYEVDASYADQITSLYLDGGNELYHEIAPLWGGDTPAFDIENFSDVKQFPNLKEITNELFPMSDDQKAQLAADHIVIS